jgi:hypothetical protein
VAAVRAPTWTRWGAPSQTELRFFVPNKGEGEGDGELIPAEVRWAAHTTLSLSLCVSRERADAGPEPSHQGPH